MEKLLETKPKTVFVIDNYPIRILGYMFLAFAIFFAFHTLDAMNDRLLISQVPELIKAIVFFLLVWQGTDSFTKRVDYVVFCKKGDEHGKI